MILVLLGVFWFPALSTMQMKRVSERSFPKWMASPHLGMVIRVLRGAGYGNPHLRGGWAKP